MTDSATGKWNIGIGPGVMVLFMLFGFFLIYMRDSIPGREPWIAGSYVSPHFEARLAHSHGNLFSHPDIFFGHGFCGCPYVGVALVGLDGHRPVDLPVI